MNYKLFSFLAAVALMVAGCAHEVETQNPAALPDAITLTVAMPTPDETQTRIAQTQDQNTPTNINLTWEIGDKLQLCFAQNGGYYRGEATLQSLGEDRKTATFSISLPTYIDKAQPFDLYGTYGAYYDSGIPASTVYFGITNLQPFNMATSGLILRLAPITGVTETTLAGKTLKLQHIGSLVAVHVKNTSSNAITVMHTSALTFENKAMNGHMAKFNVVTGELDASGFTNSLGFYISDGSPRTIPAGQHRTFWQWIYATGIAPGTIKFVFNGSYSTEAKAMTTPLAAGKTYHIYTEFNGAAIAYSDPYNIAYPDVALQKSAMSLVEGNSDTNEITDGTGDYTVSINNADIANVDIIPNTTVVRVVTKKAGSAIITVTDQITGKKAVSILTVSPLDAIPDNSAIFDDKGREITDITIAMGQSMDIYIGDKTTKMPHNLNVKWSADAGYAQLRDLVKSTNFLFGYSEGISNYTVTGAPSGMTLSLKVTVSASITPTGISFANTEIYTWPGKSNNIGFTLTPANASADLISWRETNNNNEPNDYLLKGDNSNIWSAIFYGRNSGNRASNGNIFVLIGRLPNNSSANTIIKARLNMWGSWSNSDNFNQWLNQGTGVSWPKTDTSLKIRACYAQNATEFALANNANEKYFSKIPTTEYGIVSDDADIEVTKDPDGVTYTLTRKNFDTLKEVTLIYTFGDQNFTDIITLLKN